MSYTRRGVFKLCEGCTSFSFPSLTTIDTYGFQYCYNLVSVNLPSLTFLGGFSFSRCFALTDINLPLLVNFGEQVLNDEVFEEVIGKTISLTIPAALMTCNAGLPDGDIQYLQANNTVTIITV